MPDQMLILDHCIKLLRIFRLQTNRVPKKVIRAYLTSLPESKIGGWHKTIYVRFNSSASMTKNPLERILNPKEVVKSSAAYLKIKEERRSLNILANKEANDG